MDAVDVRELQHNLSQYLTRVQEGEKFAVTEQGREVARLIPSGPGTLNRPLRFNAGRFAIYSMRSARPSAGR